MNENEYNFDTHGKPLKETHLNLFRRIESQPVNPDATLKGALVIYSSPRCGSTLFSDTLNQTKLLGYCEEWVNYEYFAAWAKVTGRAFTLPAYLEWLRLHTTPPGKSFALKIHAAQVAMIKEQFQLDVIKYFEPKHQVYVYRKDKIAQAVSLAKAVITNQFRADEKQRGDPEIIDVTHIAKFLHTSLNQEAFYHSNLSSGVSNSYAYEEFRDLKEGRRCYDETLVAMGIEPPAEYITKLKKQGNEHSRKLRDTFLQFISGDYE